MRILFTLAPLILSITAWCEDNSAMFQKQVEPVLKEYCYKCHGPDKQKGHLRLDSREALLKGGKTGPAAVPGKPEESLLIKAINYTDDDLQMPPKKKLSDDQIKLLTDWVQKGLPWSESADTSAPKTPAPAEKEEKK